MATLKLIVSEDDIAQAEKDDFEAYVDISGRVRSSADTNVQRFCAG